MLGNRTGQLIQPVDADKSFGGVGFGAGELIGVTSLMVLILHAVGVIGLMGRHRKPRPGRHRFVPTTRARRKPGYVPRHALQPSHPLRPPTPVAEPATA